MRRAADTIDESSVARDEPSSPGVLLVYAVDRPCVRAAPIGRAPLRIGRDPGGPFALDDARASRLHAEVRFDGGRFEVRDAGSRNGTFVDGARVDGRACVDAPSVVRVGDSVLLLCEDVRPWLGAATLADGDRIVGPATRAALARIAHAAKAGTDLLILGESGSGKEHAAETFHRASAHAGGALVRVNCATIPEGLAERVLFGAKRGAYSGAADAIGLVAAADGGVLFLDEIGELDADVQAKLLRFLETREVTPLGATTSRTVDVRVCFATHRDLRAGVRAQEIRADFYYRIARPSVELPTLRARLDEIPWLVAAEARRAGAVAHAKLVEACLLRRWPGNVRELLHEVRHAAEAAARDGASVLAERHLDPAAGRPFEETPPAAPPAPPTRDAIATTLAVHGGNVAATARALGIHRRQLYRYLDRFSISAK